MALWSVMPVLGALVIGWLAIGVGCSMVLRTTKGGIDMHGDAHVLNKKLVQQRV